jgi:hypothetical protein
VNKLFIELYLDEDVSVLVADLLRARGFFGTDYCRSRKPEQG